jgi:hypothetical protein
MLPLLLIPFGITALFGIGSSIDGAIRINEANERMQRRQRRLKGFYDDEAVPAARKAKLCVEALQKERLESLCALRDSAKVLGKLSHSRKTNAVLAAEGISRAHLQTWNALGVDAGEVLTNIGAGVAVGAAISSGAFAATASLGLASTGTAIASLAGVAATDATLAALGGGTLAAGGAGIAGGTLVLGGLVAAPVLIFAAIGFQCKAADSEAEASRACADMDVQESKLRREMEAAGAVGMRAKELQDSTRMLREQVAGLIRNAGNRPDLRRLAAAASALSQCLDIPITHAT